MGRKAQKKVRPTPSELGGGYRGLGPPHFPHKSCQVKLLGWGWGGAPGAEGVVGAPPPPV